MNLQRIRVCSALLEEPAPSVVQQLCDVADELAAVLRDYPAGQDDGSWLARRDAALAKLL